jgi:hypothetical protein
LVDQEEMTPRQVVLALDEVMLAGGILVFGLLIVGARRYCDLNVKSPGARKPSARCACWPIRIR